MDEVSENSNPAAAPETAAPETAASETAAPEATPTPTPQPQADGTPETTPEAASEATPEAAPEPRGRPPREKKPEAERKWRREPGLALSFRKGLPVDGKVEQVIRGGYEVRVGNARGFCPHSQMDLNHVDNPEEHVGKVYPFRVIQIRRGGEEVVLSRRALLEEGRVEEAKAVRATLIEGQVTQGHVARLADFGAFIDLGAGVTGLVHVSEVARTRIDRPADILKPGDVVRVKVLSLASSTGRISLSIRQAMADPWVEVAERYKVGTVVSGKLQRVADFGAFVELEEGLEALAPADTFPPRTDGWQSAAVPGTTGSWRVDSVDLQRRRLSVQPVTEGQSEAPAPLEAGAKMKGRVQRVEKFGVFVWLRPGLVGLMPNVHSGTKKGSDLIRAFPIGTELEVEVVEVDPDGRRVRLAVPGAVEAAAAEQPYRSQQAQQHHQQAGSQRDRPKGPPKASPRRDEPAVAAPAFGTNLGDALRAAFDRKPGES